MASLDPRVKILALVLGSLTVANEVSLSVELGVIILFILPLIREGHLKKAIRLLINYLLLMAIYFFILPLHMPSFLFFMVSFFANGIRRFYPLLAAMIYVISSSRLKEWLALFKRWHLPSWLTVPLAVMIRFFPTLKEDYQTIREAMALRGLETSMADLIRHPVAGFEHVMVPLLANASNVAEDLTISGLTKGLTVQGPSSSLYQLNFTPRDSIYSLVFILALAAVIKGGV